ncbi:MAG: substrate-binding domain-containing protein [Bacteroidota bacterium]
MITVFDKIQELEDISRLSKHEQLVNGIINAIDERILVQGNMLPSVNNMVRELGFARKTIVKAYTDLKERGIVDSRKRLGYFIANESTGQTVKVALLLYGFHAFQERFNNTFGAALGENIQVDIFFHYDNLEVFETILSNISGQYGMYVVAPIQRPKAHALLQNISPKKLLLVDRYLDLGPEYSYVTQSFEEPMYQTMLELKQVLLAYDRFVLFYHDREYYPVGLLKAFQKFMVGHQLNSEIRDHYDPGSLEKGTVYFTLGDNDLWELLKDCKEKGWTLGKDIGVLSHNDSTVKEIISDGITTFSTDFRLMAQEAANFVLTRQEVQKKIPSLLIRRKSL